MHELLLVKIRWVWASGCVLGPTASISNKNIAKNHAHASKTPKSKSTIQKTLKTIPTGGLRDEPAQGQKMGGVVMGAAGDYGLLPGQRFPTSPILRSQVADVVVDALIDPAASGKVVEIVTEASQPNRPYSELFGLVP